MNDSTLPPEDALAGASREEILSALFANMVIQQTNMAMMLMGKAAHPETGQFYHDVDSARMFIDQLEMLEVKTKGNLNKQEEGLLKQALAALHMAFVEAVDAPPTPQKSDPQPVKDQAPAAQAAPAPEAKQPAAAPVEAEAAEESRKKFSKKY
jgi:cell division septation protein DedD